MPYNKQGDIHNDVLAPLGRVLERSERLYCRYLLGYNWPNYNQDTSRIETIRKHAARMAHIITRRLAKINARYA